MIHTLTIYVAIEWREFRKDIVIGHISVKDFKTDLQFFEINHRDTSNDHCIIVHHIYTPENDEEVKYLKENNFMGFIGC